MTPYFSAIQLLAYFLAETFMKCAMEDYLKVVAPHLHSELVSTEALSHIQSLTQILPAFSVAGFECRLTDEQSRVDFQANLSYGAPSLPEKFLKHSTWRLLQGIIQQWTDAEAFLHHRVRDIWLEFDLDGEPLQVPIPCIFLTLNQEAISEPQQLLEIAAKLLNHPLPSLLESILKHSIDHLPDKAYISHIGAMMSRTTQAVRINARGMSPEQLLDYLVQIGWTDPTHTLRSLVTHLSEFVDFIHLSCDIGESVYPKIGLECFLIQQPKHEPRWQLLLNYLMEIGLCTSAKQHALLGWSGYSQKASQPELWPNNLHWGDLLLGARAFSIFTRKISHVKIVYQPGAFLEAKAYLEFCHNWFDASP
ncbi:hypothetical protein ACKFKF_04355 [Phormidesmis sp. 146-12]